MKKKTLLVGVRLDRSFSAATRSAIARLGGAKRGEVTYCRLDDKQLDRRFEKRRSAHLRWGKALDERDKFLCECAIANRTRGGACLKLTRKIDIPQKFQLYEDDSAALRDAHVVWRRGTEIGCRISLDATPGKERVISRMKSACYAL
jgi:hypothetical protein